MPDHYLGARHPTFVGRKPPVTKTKQDRERGGRGPMKLRKDRRTKAVLLDILSLPSLQEIRENPGDAGRQITETALLGHAAKGFKLGKPVFTAAKAAIAEYSALNILATTIGSMVASFLIIGKVFDYFGGKAAALVTAIMVIVAAWMMFKAAMNPLDAALSFKAMVATGVAVGGVAALMVKSIPKTDETGGTSYDAYLSEIEGGNAASISTGGGGGGPSAQTLIVDRATFRSDNLSEVDYDSIMRS